MALNPAQYGESLLTTFGHGPLNALVQYRGMIQRNSAPNTETDASEALAPAPVITPAPATRPNLKVAIGDEAQVPSPVHDLHTAIEAELNHEPMIKRWPVGPSFLVTAAVSAGLWLGLVRLGASIFH